MDLTTTPEQLMVQILTKRAIKLRARNEKCSDFTLKVCGREEYIVGSHPLIDYAYIQDSLSQDLIPILIAVSKYNVPGRLLLLSIIIIIIIIKINL